MDAAISIKSLSKMYKIYSSRKNRLLDLFNLKFALSRHAFQEFWALRDINLEIPKGGKVGIIGRNGAGKSTLLKIVCGNIEPTAGSVSVSGRVSALLELGTGFHPEFTGRENALASLAYMGVTGKEALHKLDAIVDFSELEEFIDNPIKTYSAGMYARLAFSVATSITPEILIIDEVLGAGDAYFAMKCVDKMSALTSGGSTVLFVSHDLASVQRLCDKAIWIDRGRVVMEGDTLSVSKSYGASVREQEEIRLKAKNTGLSRQTVKQMKNDSAETMLFHIINDSWTTFSGRHPIRSICLKRGGTTIDEIKVGDAMDNDPNHRAHIVTGPGYMDWGEPFSLDDGYARAAEDTGGAYKHAAFVFPLPEWIEGPPAASVELEYKDVSEEKVFLELYDGERYTRLGAFEQSKDGTWKTAVFDITDQIPGRVSAESGKPAQDSGEGQETSGEPAPEHDHEAEPVIASHDIKGDVYGTGEAVITKVQFLNKDNKEKYIFNAGETMKIRIFYKAESPISHPVFVAAIYRLDGVVAHQAISAKDGIDFTLIDGTGQLDIVYDPLYIGVGDYIVSVAIFHYIDFLSDQEPPAYCLQDRKYRFRIKWPTECKVDFGIANQPVLWSHERTSR